MATTYSFGIDTSLYPSSLGMLAWEFENAMMENPWAFDDLTSTVGGSYTPDQAYYDTMMMDTNTPTDFNWFVPSDIGYSSMLSPEDSLTNDIFNYDTMLSDPINMGVDYTGGISGLTPVFTEEEADLPWYQNIGGMIGGTLGLGVNPALTGAGYEAGSAIQEAITGPNTVRDYGDGMSEADYANWLDANKTTVNTPTSTVSGYPNLDVNAPALNIDGFSGNYPGSYSTGSIDYNVPSTSLPSTGYNTGALTPPSSFYDVNSTMPYYGSTFPGFEDFGSSNPFGSTPTYSSSTSLPSRGINLPDAPQYLTSGTGSNTGTPSTGTTGTAGIADAGDIPDYGGFGTYGGGLYDIPPAVRYPELASSQGVLSGIEQPGYVGYDIPTYDIKGYTPGTYEVPDISSMMPTADWYNNIAPEVMAGIRAPYEAGSERLREQLNAIGGLGNQSTGVSGQGASGIGEYWAQATPQIGMSAWNMVSPALQAGWQADLSKGIYDANAGTTASQYLTGLENQRNVWGAQNELLRSQTEADYLQNLADTQYGLRQQENQKDYESLLEQQRGDYQAMQNYRNEILGANQMPWSLLPGLLGGSYPSTGFYNSSGGGTNWLGGIGAGLGTYGNLSYANDGDLSGGDWASVIGSTLGNL